MDILFVSFDVIRQFRKLILFFVVCTQHRDTVKPDGSNVEGRPFLKIALMSDNPIGDSSDENSKEWAKIDVDLRDGKLPSINSNDNGPFR